MQQAECIAGKRDFFFFFFFLGGGGGGGGLVMAIKVPLPIMCFFFYGKYFEVGEKKMCRSPPVEPANVKISH